MHCKSLKYGGRRLKWVVVLLPFILHPSSFGQQPQAQSGQPIYPVNAKYVQGVGPGYWPTAGSGLTLNLSAGTAYCGAPPALVAYAGGTLTMAASQTSYVYLDPTASCAPTTSVTAFGGSQIPIAKVVTGGSAITSITDARTWFSPGLSSLEAIRFAADFANGSSTGGIQEAINNVCALTPKGGTVWLPWGTTTITAAVNVACNSLEIRGHGFNALINSTTTDIFTFPAATVMDGLIFKDFAATTTGAGKSVFNFGSATIFRCEFDTLRLTASGGNGSSAIKQPSTASVGLSYFHDILSLTTVNNVTTGLLDFEPGTGSYMNGNFFRNIYVDQTGLTAGVPAIQIILSGTGAAALNVFDGVQGEVCNFGTFKLVGVSASVGVNGTVVANLWNGDRGGAGVSTNSTVQIGPYANVTELANIVLGGYSGTTPVSVDSTAVGLVAWNIGSQLDNAQVEIRPPLDGVGSPTVIPLILGQASGQTGDSLQVRNSSGAVLFRVDKNGYLWGGTSGLLTLLAYQNTPILKILGSADLPGILEVGKASAGGGNNNGILQLGIEGSLAQVYGDANGNLHLGSTVAGKSTIVDIGLNNNGGGFKHVRVASPLGGTCPTGASVGNACTSANINWTTAFADNNYTLACTLDSPTNQPHIVNTTKLANGAGFTVTIATDTAAAANSGVECVALHD